MKLLIKILQGPMSDDEFREFAADGITAVVGAVWLVLMFVMFGESWLERM